MNFAPQGATTYNFSNCNSVSNVANKSYDVVVRGGTMGIGNPEEDSSSDSDEESVTVQLDRVSGGGCFILEELGLGLGLGLPCVESTVKLIQILL
jgi:hypothetical protein